MAKELVTFIERYQNGDTTAANELMSRFRPLLIRYARFLHAEDAFEELQLQFLIAIKSIKLDTLQSTEDGAIANYFKSIVKNYYIEFSKKSKRCVSATSLEDMEAPEQVLYQADAFWTDSHDKLFLEDIRVVLTKKEYDILVAHYVQGIPILKIAILQKIRRQTVNETKLVALKKLKAHFTQN